MMVVLLVVFWCCPCSVLNVFSLVSCLVVWRWRFGSVRGVTVVLLRRPILCLGTRSASAEELLWLLGSVAGSIQRTPLKPEGNQPFLTSRSMGFSAHPSDSAGVFVVFWGRS